MENQINNQMSPINQTSTAPGVQTRPVKNDDAFETIQKLLMVFIFILTISMFSYWGYQSVMYVLAVSFGVVTEYTPYDMFIGIIAMISSISLFTGSFMWWRKHVTAEGFLKYGTIGFVIKDALEIPNAIVPLTKLSEVTSGDLGIAASAIGYDLFKIGFWVLAMFVFKYAIKKHKELLAR